MRDAETMLQLLGKASSINVRKVLWTCEEVGVDYVREDWGSGFRSPVDLDFLRMNPNGLVPVLVDEAGALWESNTICRYLASKHGRIDLLPEQPRQRALVEQWMDWQATELNASWRDAFLGLVRRDPAFLAADRIDAGVRRWNAAMGILEEQLNATGAYAAGSEFTLADIVLGLSVNRWSMTPMSRPDYPAIRAYKTRLLERPAYRTHGCNGLP